MVHEIIIALLTLIALEIILSIDNVVIISILAQRLSDKQKKWQLGSVLLLQWCRGFFILADYHNSETKERSSLCIWRRSLWQRFDTFSLRCFSGLRNKNTTLQKLEKNAQNLYRSEMTKPQEKSMSFLYNHK